MSGIKHLERTFEDAIVEHLTAHGWRLVDPQRYDAALALYPADVLGWLEETQPKALAKVAVPASGTVAAVVLARLAQALDKEGALRVLRRGFKHVSASFTMSQPRPSQGLNPATLALYAQVRCTVIRQVRYSRHKGDSIDLVFCVNGIPVATAELKTDFTQTLADAIAQYQHDRPPKDPYTKESEPLLAGRRAIVHFAVSTDRVAMTTQLAGPATRFLPFDIGDAGGAGNPPNPHGYRTAYLWERVLGRDSLLDIIANFAHAGTVEEVAADGTRQQQEMLIFPRYHQWEAVGALLAAAKREGPGHNYLIQHSAGSGKSNSIAWLAHRLATLHDAADKKLFDSVIVVTDRTVLDQQLRETIYQFEHKSGVVVPIKDDGPAKSEQLKKALLARAPIIIVTLQTFPFVIKALAQEQALAARAYAVIADEAHSSQTGSAASGLTEALTGGANGTNGASIADGDDEEPFDGKEEMLADMAARAEHRNVSYFAFTATPKAKTLQRFGRVPDPTRPESDTNLPAAFHVYTMQQAIEEGFILDVLQNYTPYRLAFKLAHNGAEYDEVQVDQAAALKSLMRWVRLHPYNIAQKVAIIVEHFRATVRHLLDGRAKAMVVTGSRKEAVRYKLALDSYLKQQGYADLAALVAFSGEVDDPESGPTPFSEGSMNPGLRGRDIRNAFRDDFQVLIVANKYQTGFDQPLLCAMYVDKRLDGIAAVQTLSRLNRIAPGKEATYILDFVNDPQQILDAFKPYYRRAELAGVTDPNAIHALQGKLDDEQIYTDAEVAGFVKAFFDPRGKQRDLQQWIAPAVQRFRVRWQGAVGVGDKGAIDTLEVFRKDLATFVRLYDFLSQIINYADTDLEGRAIFFRHLLPSLRADRLEREQIDLSGVLLTHYKLRLHEARQLALGDGEGDYRLTPPTDLGSALGGDPVRAQLAAIIRRMNELFEGDLTDADFLNFTNYVRDKMVENPVLQQQARANSKEQFALGEFQAALTRATIATLGNHHAMAEQVFADERKRAGFGAILLDMVWQELQGQERAR